MNVPIVSSEEYGRDLRDVADTFERRREEYSLNAKGNFQFERVIGGWRNRPVLDLRLKR